MIPGCVEPASVDPGIVVPGSVVTRIVTLREGIGWGSSDLASC